MLTSLCLHAGEGVYKVNDASNGFEDAVKKLQRKEPLNEMDKKFVELLLIKKKKEEEVSVEENESTSDEESS